MVMDHSKVERHAGQNNLSPIFHVHAGSENLFIYQILLIIAEWIELG